MKYISVLMCLLVLCVSVGSAQDALEKIISLRIRTEIPVRSIIGTIAKLTNTNIVVDPKVRTRMSLELKDIRAIDALNVVAGINGLKMVAVRGVIVVGLPETIKNVIGPRPTEMFRLSYAKAEDVAALINQVMKNEARATAYSPTNAVIVTPTGVE